MQDCKPTATPAELTPLIKPSNDSTLPDVPYRQAIGSLMYLMLGSRPDIAQALSKVAQFATCYDHTHWTAVKRIIRYVRGTINHALTLGGLSRGHNFVLTGSCDADWGGDPNDRRSTSGYIFLLNSQVISWNSHKQATVATSSTQAEYQALSSAVKEAIWIRMLLTEIGFHQTITTTIQQDNQSTIALAHNPIIVWTS